MITRLDDARAFKRMKMPLNTPVEDREFSAAWTEHWIKLNEARNEFERAVCEYADDSRPAKWRKMRRRLKALDKATAECVPLIDSVQDDGERGLIAFFLTKRAVPYIQFWEEAFDAVEAGAELIIRPGDVPVWFDKED